LPSDRWHYRPDQGFVQLIRVFAYIAFGIAGAYLGYLPSQLLIDTDLGSSLQRNDVVAFSVVILPVVFGTASGIYLARKYSSSGEL
jgi:hypothetical protein